jgi:hypothetical protein
MPVVENRGGLTLALAAAWPRTGDQERRPVMSYQPAPLDTSDVVLTTEIGELMELLARHVHDVWARQRLADGWRYGTERNDSRKEHPGLRPYEQLSDVEKEYDRKTAAETLKAIIVLGYRIEKA